MGASGNMVMAALYELLPDKSLFHEKMNKLSLPGVNIEYTKSVKCGISGTHISVTVDGVEEHSHDEHTHEHNHEDSHSHSHDHHNSHTHTHTHHNAQRFGYKELLNMIDDLDLSGGVKSNAKSIYKLIGEAESKVHGTSLEDIHFHEVGSIDAFVDVIGCCILLEFLNISNVIVSPVHVGYGMVRCEHGILPIPAPATAEILKDVPIYSGQIEGELCTPTGAALLKHFATSFGQKPQMTVKAIGYGMGTKDFKAANCLRAYLYITQGTQVDGSSVFEISCNLDDMTPEAIGAAIEILSKGGALDIFTTPIMMKKNRPAVKLSCLCSKENLELLVNLILTNTTSLGVRYVEFSRTTLERSTEIIKTEYGDIRVKHAKGDGIVKLKPEYDDVQAAALKHNVPFQTVYNATTRGL